MIIERIWPQWKVEKEIGRGSYGVVYKCSRENNGEKEYAAIKVISLDSNNDPSYSGSLSVSRTRAFYEEVIDDIRNEAELLRSLRGNKNIVEIKESASVETEDGFVLLIRMDLLESFERYITERELKEKEIVKLGTDLCEALIACHERGIIHRDIKPKNILVDPKSGNFMLSDFGVAKKLEGRGYASSLKGNYEFMAPEVIHEQKSDARSDVYSLGLVMYWLLNGCTLPFVPKDGIIKYSDYKKAFDKRMSGEMLPEIEGVPKKLNQIILKACQYKPGNRYRSAAEFQQALKEEEPPFDWKKLVVTVTIVLSLAICSFAGYRVYKYLRDRIPDTTEGSDATILSETPGIEGIKIRLGDEFIDPIPVDISEHRQIGDWGYFLYLVEYESIDGSETPDLERRFDRYPALFRYSLEDRVAQRVNDGACRSYQIAQDCVYYVDAAIVSEDHGKLYVVRPDGKNARMLAEEVSDFEIIDDKYIFFAYGSHITGDGYQAHGLYRMNLDGSDSKICAFPVSAIIDGKKDSFDAESFPGNVRDGWVDCGSFKLELAFPATGRERIVVQDAVDNDWVYYITDSLMKIRKDGSEQTVLDEDRYDEEGNEYSYYDILRVEDNWVYYQKGNDAFRIRTDGTWFEPVKETEPFSANEATEPDANPAGEKQQTITSVSSSVIPAVSSNDTSQNTTVPSTTANPQTTTTARETQRPSSTTAASFSTTQDSTTAQQPPITKQADTTTETTEKEKKTVTVTCVPVWTITDTNAVISVNTSFNAVKVDIYAVDASGNKYGPIDNVMKSDDHTWRCNCNFYVKSTFTITAIAYDADGEKTQGTTTYTYS